MPLASTSPALENTSERQAALRRYHILDTAPEKDFDRITSLVAKVCGASTALITLIDEERQWFKSCFNFDVRQTMRLRCNPRRVPKKRGRHHLQRSLLNPPRIQQRKRQMQQNIQQAIASRCALWLRTGKR